MPDFLCIVPLTTGPILVGFIEAFWMLQVALVVHVYRMGRPYWWVWVLCTVPMLGGVAYAAVELLPAARRSRGRLYGLKPLRWRIADRRQTLREAETIENRLALAEELFESGRIDEAHGVAIEALKGGFRNDPRTMVEVARYKLALRRHAEACSLLDEINVSGDKMLQARISVMRADCLRGLGRYAEAEYAYATALSRYNGEAPRAGLALVYEETGREEKAREIWTEIRAKFRRSNPSWRKNEHAWFKMATVKLTERGAPS